MFTFRLFMNYDANLCNFAFFTIFYSKKKINKKKTENFTLCEFIVIIILVLFVVVLEKLKIIVKNQEEEEEVSSE